jgi:twitching motility protein PilT
MASMLDAINEFRNEHIITIEDPIEYIFHNKKSIFSQREVGRDTLSFAHAIRSAMREDADIIMIGEIRDTETMEIALSLAETGHLVFSTLHTSGSVQTLSRMIQFFPSELEVQVQNRLADSLIGVLSQRLVTRKDGKGRIAIRELMYVTSGIRNLIVQGDFTQIPNAIEM